MKALQRSYQAASASLAAAVLLSALMPASARAETIIDDWSSIKAPAAPKLSSVTINPKGTALLLLDFNGAKAADSGPCNATTKPRCLASLPQVEKLMKEARAAGLPIIYSITTNAKPADIAAVLKPQKGDAIVKAGANKFIGTDLQTILKDKGINTVIVTGTASEGAVLNTAAYAALTGMDVILPVDGMSSTDPYAEQYVAWHFTHAPGVSTKTTLTKIDDIRFPK